LGRHKACPYVGDGVDEPVATPGQRLHIAGRVGIVAQGLSQLLDGGLDAVLVLDDRAVRPQRADDLVVSYQVPGALQQQLQNLKRLFLQLYLGPVAAQFSGLEVYCKDPEAYQAVVGVEMTQRRLPSASETVVENDAPGTAVIVAWVTIVASG